MGGRDDSTQASLGGKLVAPCRLVTISCRKRKGGLHSSFSFKPGFLMRPAKASMVPSRVSRVSRASRDNRVSSNQFSRVSKASRVSRAKGIKRLPCQSTSPIATAGAARTGEQRQLVRMEGVCGILK
jgi:hypothetical protein